MDSTDGIDPMVFIYQLLAVWNAKIISENTHLRVLRIGYSAFFLSPAASLPLLFIYSYNNFFSLERFPLNLITIPILNSIWALNRSLTFISELVQYHTFIAYKINFRFNFEMLRDAVTITTESQKKSKITTTTRTTNSLSFFSRVSIGSFVVLVCYSALVPESLFR